MLLAFPGLGDCRQTPFLTSMLGWGRVLTRSLLAFPLKGRAYLEVRLHTSALWESLTPRERQEQQGGRLPGLWSHSKVTGPLGLLASWRQGRELAHFTLLVAL